MDPQSSDRGSSLAPIGDQLPSLSTASQNPTSIGSTTNSDVNKSQPVLHASDLTNSEASANLQVPRSGAIATTQSSIPPVAADTDLIEKEWVIKAKQIVHHTKDDPYEQSRQLTIFKAAYIKQRYNRTIQLDD
jgi:hypothetical protein